MQNTWQNRKLECNDVTHLLLHCSKWEEKRRSIFDTNKLEMEHLATKQTEACTKIDQIVVIHIWQNKQTKVRIMSMRVKVYLKNVEKTLGMVWQHNKSKVNPSSDL